MAAPPPSGLRAVSRLAGGGGLPLVAFFARLPAGLLPTGTLMMVTALSGIGQGGLVAGVLWMGQATGGPLIGRLADRYGHRPVLLTASLVNAAAIAALVGSVACVATHRSPALQTALAALTGLTVPQIGPLSRTRWIALAQTHPEGRQLADGAVSFDTTVDEISFVAGPALAGILTATVHPTAGLIAAAALIAVFGTVFALHPTAPHAAPRTVKTSKVWSAPLVVLVLLTIGQGLVFGAANAGTNALAKGDPGLAGLVWATMGATSAGAGLLTTAFPGRRDTTVRLRVAVAAQSVLVMLLLIVHSALGATPALAVIGLAVAPILIALFTLAERIAPAERMAEAMTLLSSGLIIGQGVAATAGGRLAAADGYAASYGLSCAAACVTMLLALTAVHSRRYRRRTARPVAQENRPAAEAAGR